MDLQKRDFSPEIDPAALMDQPTSVYSLALNPEFFCASSPSSGGFDEPDITQR
jgi:hypothetical protein